MTNSIPTYVSPDLAQVRSLRDRALRRLRWWRDDLGNRAAAAGLPPALMAHRFRKHVPAATGGKTDLIHPARVITAAPPANRDPASLSDDPGWFGFSFRDVPTRHAGPTRLISLSEARVLAGQTPSGDFSPAIIDNAGRSLDLREIRYRPFHAPLSLRAPDMVRPRAVWVAERVFDNYAHWFTAHLGKLVLLRDQGLLGDLVLPADRPAWLDASLARVGVSPAAELPRGAVLMARELILLESDRFRPELLRVARDAAADVSPDRGANAGKKIFISRRSARGRRLLGEDNLAPLLERYGFGSTEMEKLDFDAQVALMARTRLLLAPHGAGLANMLFCPEGCTVVEIADPAYPNPNFYAMAAALGHRYVLVDARGHGTGHPLRRDLSVEPAALQAALEAVL